MTLLGRFHCSANNWLYSPHNYLGQPVAWAISDKEDVDTLEVVWMSIKQRCPDADVNTIMIDDGE